MTEPIRYRVTWWQSLWPLALVATPQIVFSLAVGVPAVVWAGITTLWCALFAESFWIRTFGVELTDEALIMRGVRKRVIPWHRVDWIGPTRYWGATMVSVRYGGRLRRLRAPYHQRFFAPDPDFETKARTIHAWWARAASPTPPRPA